MSIYVKTKVLYKKKKVCEYNIKNMQKKNKELKIIQRDMSDSYANDSNIQNHINWTNSRKNPTYAFSDTSTTKRHCKLIWTCLNIKSKCVFCPMCGSGDPLRGISAAPSRIRRRALLREQEHTHDTHRANPQDCTPHVKWRCFKTQQALLYSSSILVS